MAKLYPRLGALIAVSLLCLSFGAPSGWTAEGQTKAGAQVRPAEFAEDTNGDQLVVSILPGLSEIAQAHQRETDRIETLKKIVVMRAGWSSRVSEVIELRNFVSIQRQVEIDGFLSGWIELNAIHEGNSFVEARKALSYFQEALRLCPPSRIVAAFEVAKKVVEAVKNQLIQLNHGDRLNVVQARELTQLIFDVVDRADQTSTPRSSKDGFNQLGKLTKELERSKQPNYENLVQNIAIFASLFECDIENSVIASHLENQRVDRERLLWTCLGVSVGLLAGEGICHLPKNFIEIYSGYGRMIVDGVAAAVGGVLGMVAADDNVKIFDSRRAHQARQSALQLRSQTEALLLDHCSQTLTAKLETQ